MYFVYKYFLSFLKQHSKESKNELQKLKGQITFNKKNSSESYFCSLIFYRAIIILLFHTTGKHLVSTISIGN